MPCHAVLALEARLLRERLEQLERAATGSNGDSAIAVDDLRARGPTPSPQEEQWLRRYGGAPCQTLDDAVDLVLLWRTWGVKRKLREGTSRSD